jgi:Na+-transporting methylmalonyl-CoA/oxaloacetate decarboxylase gamma subunit
MIQWALFFHVLAVLALLATHGTSMVVLYRIRGERDRAKILSLLTMSGETTIPMYVSLGAVLVTGVWNMFAIHALGKAWVWLAIAILVVVVGLMTAVAKPYFTRVKAACEVRPSGVPRVSDEELTQITTSSTGHLIMAIGVVGLAAILYLMVFKPWQF